jgi:hypothetical protein
MPDLPVQWREVLGNYAVGKGTIGNAGEPVEAKNFGHVLGHALTPDGTRHQPAGWPPSRCRVAPLYPSQPRARSTHDYAVRIFLGIFAEVPDSALLVLGIPVMGQLLHGTVHKHCVDHFNAGDSHEDPRRVGDFDCIEFFTRVGHALVCIDFAWLERKERVVDLRGEVAGINHGLYGASLASPTD